MKKKILNKTNKKDIQNNIKEKFFKFLFEDLKEDEYVTLLHIRKERINLEKYENDEEVNYLEFSTNHKTFQEASLKCSENVMYKNFNQYVCLSTTNGVNYHYPKGIVACGNISHYLMVTV